MNTMLTCEHGFEPGDECAHECDDDCIFADVFVLRAALILAHRHGETFCAEHVRTMQERSRRFLRAGRLIRCE